MQPDGDVQNYPPPQPPYFYVAIYYGSGFDLALDQCTAAGEQGIDDGLWRDWWCDVTNVITYATLYGTNH